MYLFKKPEKQASITYNITLMVRFYPLDPVSTYKMTTLIRKQRLRPLEYTQYPFIRNALIRNDAEISGNFKKPAFKGSNLRNALK